MISNENILLIILFATIIPSLLVFGWWLSNRFVKVEKECDHKRLSMSYGIPGPNNTYVFTLVCYFCGKTGKYVLDGTRVRVEWDNK